MPLAGLRVTRALKHPFFASLGARGDGAGDESGEGEEKHGVGEGGRGDGMQNVDLALTFILEGGMQPELNSSKSKSHFSRSAQVISISNKSAADDFEMVLLRQISASDRMLSDPYS